MKRMWDTPMIKWVQKEVSIKENLKKGQEAVEIHDYQCPEEIWQRNIL